MNNMGRCNFNTPDDEIHSLLPALVPAITLGCLMQLAVALILYSAWMWVGK